MRVRLICGDRIADEVEISVPEGGVAHVVLAPVPTAARGVAAESMSPTSSQPVDVTSEPWFWAVVGIGGAALIAGVTVGIVFAAQPSGSTGDFDVPTLRFELRP